MKTLKIFTYLLLVMAMVPSVVQARLYLLGDFNYFQTEWINHSSEQMYISDFGLGIDFKLRDDAMFYFETGMVLSLDDYKGQTVRSGLSFMNDPVYLDLNYRIVLPKNDAAAHIVDAKIKYYLW